MDVQVIWLTKLLLAHLLTDFVLQPSHWVKSRNKEHFRSKYLYLHGIITAFVALLFIGTSYWLVVLIIFVTHIIIDGWKSYQKEDVKPFLVDQLLHLLVIFGCWYISFLHPANITAAWQAINTKDVWIRITAFVFVTQPSAILIGQLTKKWRSQIQNSESLGDAGKWIGIIERIIIIALVLNQQYASVGLLLTAKGLLRFNEPNRQEVKTEYLLIGTLMSFGLAALTGIITAQLVAG
jgi:hypothetical protein